MGSYKNPNISYLNHQIQVLVTLIIRVGREARVGRGLKAESGAKAGNVARVGRGPKAVGEKREESAEDMRHVGLESGRPDV